ncbi:chlorophyllide a reductase subunit Y [Halorhodospira abdelmalekii]|uniref:chlorophyllide a reductase subunit Y n=1 Tax=Halorhodospira abdelmalekii TaxID=421629 RepID=UPI001903FD55|nr:chlorophyllide a reductase subunit Y [Halorhodospira abdelmalekii]MBK1735213.1 chlorophyllide a reductase subunit Y [Halorhodospira abdelmalekii]
MSERAGVFNQPQTMCPAFGSLRVGLRMRRMATVAVGSACCVYGLSFTGHFYGARRSIGYVPFDSESLITGGLFEDVHQAVYELADPRHYDAIVVVNLCVPSASGVPLRLLPEAINGVRILPLDVPGFGVTTHAEAKDRLAAAMLRYARSEAERGPVKAPRSGRAQVPVVTLLGEMFPGDAVSIGRMLEPMGLAAGQVVPTREWRELYAALDCRAAAAIHPHYTASLAEFEAAGRPAVPSAPVGREGTEAWLEAVGEVCGVSREAIAAAKEATLPVLEEAIAAAPIRGKVTISGYEGSELLVARLLVECGAEVCAVNTALPQTPWSDPDRSWLEARGIPVRFRATLRDESAAVDAHRPDLAIGTTPLAQRAKERAIPGLYFTNLISARPLMGPAGPGSLAQVINAAIGYKERCTTMNEFFAGVGQGPTAGIWHRSPHQLATALAQAAGSAAVTGSAGAGQRAGQHKGAHGC